MECLNSGRAISAFVDRAECEQELQDITAHVVDCMPCSDAVADHRRIRQDVRNLPTLQPSEHLRTSLRVIASHERARRIRRLNFASAFAAWRDRASLAAKNMMQPIALPVAGGFLSAALLFTTLVPDFFSREVHPVSDDVPTVLFTDASVKDAIWPVIGEAEIVVDLTIDESGRLTEYKIVNGGPWLHDEGLRRRFESALLLTQFTPATQFGQPTSGKVRVSFRSSRIDIKG